MQKPCCKPYRHTVLWSHNHIEGSFIAHHLTALCSQHMEQYSSMNPYIGNHSAIYILSIKVQECIFGLQVRYGQYRPHTLQTQNLLLSRII